jgi:hypothetical protein
MSIYSGPARLNPDPYPWRRKPAPPSVGGDPQPNEPNSTVRFKYYNTIDGRIIVNEALNDVGSIRNEYAHSKFISIGTSRCLKYDSVYNAYGQQSQTCVHEITVKRPPSPLSAINNFIFSLGANIEKGRYQDVSESRQCVLGFRPNGRGIDYIDIEFSGWEEVGQGTYLTQLSELIGYYLNGRFSSDPGPAPPGSAGIGIVQNDMSPEGAYNWTYDNQYRLESLQITSPPPFGMGLNLLGNLGGVSTYISVTWLTSEKTANISVTMYTDNPLINAQGNNSTVLISYSWLATNIENACSVIRGLESINSTVLTGTGTAFIGPQKLKVSAAGRTTDEVF